MSAATADNGKIKMKNELIRKTVDDETGFTLVEIIAVLVILGILAAVAVPKYFDLQTKAKSKAMAGAMAEATGRVTQYFGEQILSGVDYENIDYQASNLGVDMGDFTLDVINNSGTADTIELQVTGKAGTGLAGEVVTKDIRRPGSP